MWLGHACGILMPVGVRWRSLSDEPQVSPSPAREGLSAFYNLARSVEQTMGNDDLYQQAIIYYSRMAVENPARYFYEAWHDCYTWKGRALLEPLNIFGGVIVVRPTGKKSTKEKAKPAWNTTFVDIPLHDVSEDDIFGQFKSTEAVYEVVAELLESGYRLGFTYNPQNDAFICSVTCKDENSPNANQTFTAFAGTWFESLLVALYKHHAVAAGVWAKGASKVAKSRFG